jgi:hypothetical protein
MDLQGPEIEKPIEIRELRSFFENNKDFRGTIAAILALRSTCKEDLAGMSHRIG